MKKVLSELYRLKGITVDESLRRKELHDRCFTVDFNEFTSPLGWIDNLHINYMFLKHCQLYFNDVLQVQGYVFLNEVLNELGLKKTKIGHYYGWLKNNSTYIDFGLTDFYYKTNSTVNNIKLHFNCELMPIVDHVYF